jgi:hypothetical protein
MASKILLCVSADRATAGIWRSRKLTGCRSFDNTEAGWNAFGSFLTTARATSAYVMADTVDEDYRFETLPHASGGDRAEMVARKLKQLYRGTSYFSYSLQSRDADKRKDDRYLFAALTSPELLSPWLKAINAHALPVAGVFSLPMVSANLLGHLKLKHPNLLVVSKGNAGVRQTFFKNLKFRISRLTPLRETADSADAADQYYADEVSNTRMYLDALTITHVDDTLQVVILDQDDSLTGLPAAISRGRPNMQCTLLGRADIISRFAIAPREIAASNDALHLHLLGEGKPAHNFAPPQVTQSFQRFLGRRMVYVASAAVLAVALAWSGFNMLDAMNARDETALKRSETSRYQRLYQEVTAQFPESPTSTDNLRSTIQIAGQLKQSVRMPDAMLAVVGRALDAVPQIQLMGIEWKYDVSAPETTAGSTPPEPLQQTCTVRGEVSPFTGDYKGAMAQINDFAARLASDARVARVQAVVLPFNASSESGMSGNTNTPAGSSGAQFEFNVVFKAGA